MSEVRQPTTPNEEQRKEQVSQLLDFIDQTALTASALQFYSQFTSDFAAQYTEAETEYYESEIRVDLARINGFIVRLGGIEVDFIDPRDGEHMAGKITSLQGLENATARYSLLFKNSNYQQGINVPLTREELRAAARPEIE
jgi:hypothetical protein